MAQIYANLLPAPRGSGKPGIASASVLDTLLVALQVVAMIAFWFVAIIVIPAAIALYVPLLFPLTGQWRKRWTAWRQRRRGTDERPTATD